MADDLVKRLRRYAKDQGGWHNIDETCEAAADRIEQLEAALQWIIDVDPVFMRSADQHPTYCKCHRCAMDNARSVMEAKNV